MAGFQTSTDQDDQADEQHQLEHVRRPPPARASTAASTSASAATSSPARRCTAACADLGGDTLDLGQRRILGGADPGFGLGELGCELGIELGLPLGRLGGEAVLRLLELRPPRCACASATTASCLRSASSASSRRSRGPVEIGGDPLLARFEDLADPRQRLAAEQPVEGERS